MSRRLPHVEERLALQMMRADLVRDHHRPPPPGRSELLVSLLAGRTTPACRRSSSVVLLQTDRSAAVRGVAPASPSCGVAWTSPRFGSRESPATPETGAFDDTK